MSDATPRPSSHAQDGTASHIDSDAVKEADLVLMGFEKQVQLLEAAMKQHESEREKILQNVRSMEDLIGRGSLRPTSALDSANLEGQRIQALMTERGRLIELLREPSKEYQQVKNITNNMVKHVENLRSQIKDLRKAEAQLENKTLNSDKVAAEKATLYKSMLGGKLTGKERKAANTAMSVLEKQQREPDEIGSKKIAAFLKNIKRIQDSLDNLARGIVVIPPVEGIETHNPPTSAKSAMRSAQQVLVTIQAERRQSEASPAQLERMGQPAGDPVPPVAARFGQARVRPGMISPMPGTPYGIVNSPSRPIFPGTMFASGSDSSDPRPAQGHPTIENRGYTTPPSQNGLPMQQRPVAQLPVSNPHPGNGRGRGGRGRGRGGRGQKNPPQ